MNSRDPGIAFAAALGAITLIGPLSIHLFLPAMPDVKESFNASDALVQLTFSVTLMTMAVVTPVYGTLSDRYGRRPVLLLGLAFFLLGSLVSAVASSVTFLIIGRLIQAMGAGCGLTLTRAIARDAYGPAALVKAIAYLTMAYTLGPMVAPPFGGILIDAFGWRSAFWFAFGAGVVITGAAVVVLHETHGQTARALASTGVLRSYAVLLRDLRFLAFVLQSGFMSFMFFTIAAASPFLMKDLLHRTATEYGLYFMCFPIGYCTGNLISSRLSGKVAVELMVLIGSVLALAALAGQSTLILLGHLSPALIFVPGGLMSFSQGLSLPNAQAGAIRVKPELAGTAAGLAVFTQMLLSALATEIYGLVADGTPIPMVEISAVGGVLAVVAASALFIVPPAKRREDTAMEPAQWRVAKSAPSLPVEDR